MWAPLSLCLLSALLATGSALLCEVCESNGKPCSGPLQPCHPLEETCVNFIARFNMEAHSFTYTSKSCLERVNCEPGPFMVTFPQNISVQLNIDCCETDGCNARTIPVPAVSLIPNGRQCPSCYAEGGKRCMDMEPLPCTGAEDHCVDVAGRATIGMLTMTIAAAGCGTPDSRILRVGEKKYTEGLVAVITRAISYAAPLA